MHEVGLAHQVLSQVREAVAENRLTRVEEVIIRCGDQTGIHSDCLQEALQLLGRESPFLQTRFDVRFEPGFTVCVETVLGE